jgi:hypothetical protein
VTIGTLYDTAKRYLPELTTREFVLFYNQALEKISYDLNIAEVTEVFTGADVAAMPTLATKILDVIYDGSSLSRVMKR